MNDRAATDTTVSKIFRLGSGSAAAAGLSVLMCLPSGSVQAVEIGVVGLFPGKAVLVVDGAAPKTYTVGSQIDTDSKLTAADDQAATFKIHGKTLVIPIGSHINRVAPGAGSSITMQADSQGHYITMGQINGGSIRMLVDTGATMIALPAADAVRLGIDYRRGQPGFVNTANGSAAVYRVKLESVRIGDLQLSQVDATVQESGLPFALLGMSFLSRTDINRSGSQMTLTKRY